MEKKVLIIEDDKDITDLVEIHLQDLGYSLDKAYDGESGLSKALSGSYDLVLLDLMLPKLEGLEVCKRIREQDKALPILMLTSRSEEMDKILGLALGADDYIIKPFSIRELIARVKANLRSVEAIKEEVSKATDAFNKMAATIEANIQEIKNNDRLRRDLIANISHDLRSPLASIQGYLETIMIKEEKLSSTERRDYLEIVYKNFQRLNRLVDDLLELSKLDAKQIKPKPEHFSIAELTQDVVLKFKPQAEKQHITIHSDFPSGIPIVEGDIGMIERALSNLLDNALIYTPEKGTVTVELQDKEKKVSVKVTDNGKGISDTDLPRVFDRFYRADKSRSTEGTGLGLAITKKIIDAHHGEITVQSHLNKGTTFQFELQKPNY